MGTNSLTQEFLKKRIDCKCRAADLRSVYEDHIFMGSIYYGKECVKCGKFFPRPPGSLELGVYK